MHYTRTTEIITASSIAASSCYSGYYLNGKLLEIGLRKHSVQPITTAPYIKLYRETSAANNLIMKTQVPSSWAWYRPRFFIPTSSTGGKQVANSSFISSKEPLVFANERILIKVGETSKTAYRKFELMTRIDGIAIPYSTANS